jgi:hypothetical protein
MKNEQMANDKTQKAKVQSQNPKGQSPRSNDRWQMANGK